MLIFDWLPKKKESREREWGGEETAFWWKMCALSLKMFARRLPSILDVALRSYVPCRCVCYFSGHLLENQSLMKTTLFCCEILFCHCWKLIEYTILWLSLCALLLFYWLQLYRIYYNMSVSVGFSIGFFSLVISMRTTLCDIIRRGREKRTLRHFGILFPFFRGTFLYFFAWCAERIRLLFE